MRTFLKKLNAQKVGNNGDYFLWTQMISFQVSPNIIYIYVSTLRGLSMRNLILEVDPIL